MARRGRRPPKTRNVRIALGAVAVLLGMIAGMNCSFQGGVLVGDGGTSTKAYGHAGADDRFTWTENEIVDRASGIVWDRHAQQRLPYADAVRACSAMDARLPTQAELESISEFLPTDLFDPGAPSDDAWSSSEGVASGRSGVHVLGVDATAVVRCVRPLHAR